MCVVCKEPYLTHNRCLLNSAGAGQALKSHYVFCLSCPWASMEKAPLLNWCVLSPHNKLRAHYGVPRCSGCQCLRVPRIIYNFREHRR